ETCIESIVFEGDLSQYSHEIQLAPIGKALAHCKALILDPQDQPCPVGQIGEIGLQGTHIPVGHGTYRTGDLGRFLHDGNIEWIGRKDNQVSQAGIRVELDEISRLIERLSPVLEAVTVQLSFPPVHYLASMVLVNDLGKLSISDVRAYLKTVLPHSLIPQKIQLVTALPRNVHGKADCEAVQNQLSIFIPSLDEPFENPLEELLAGLLKSVWPATPFERDDDLIDLGLDSLTIIRWLHLLAQNNLHVDMATLYSARSIRRLSDHLSTLSVQQTHSETPKPALRDFSSQAQGLLADIYAMEKRQQQFLLSSEVTEEWGDTLLGKEFIHFYPHHYFLDYVSLYCSEELLASRLATLFQHHTILRSSLHSGELALYRVYEWIPRLQDLLIPVTDWGKHELKDFIGEVLFPYLAQPIKSISSLPARWFIFEHEPGHYTVVWALLESIHDQFGSSLIRRYLSGGITREPSVSLLTHYRQLTKGPRELSDSELSEIFGLERFVQLCKEISISWDYPVTTSLDGSVDLFIPIPPNLDVFVFALALFGEYVHFFTQQTQIPALFMTDTRQFDPPQLKTLVGDFTDYMPFILDRSKNPNINVASLRLSLDRCTKHWVHFRSLGFENSLSLLYPHSHSLIRKTFGDGLSFRHPFIFHFRTESDSSHEIGLDRKPAHPYLPWMDGGYLEFSLHETTLHLQGTFPFEVSQDRVQKHLESYVEFLRPVRL
ncbi:MAG: phosphopantetheine-binding protein, partial [Candidatus Margulisiibacteriota bacterium]